ncbi:MAG: hypothetical protein ACRD3G_17990 [Vicinamibacterales bacterium]
MRAKTGKRNRTSGRASLRKIVATVTPRRTGAKTRTASPAARSTAKGTRGAEGRFALAPRTVVVGTLCVVAAAALLMGRPSSRTWEVMAVDEAGNVERLEQVANGDAVDPEALIDQAVALPRSSARTTSSSPAPVAPPKGIEPAPAAWESASKPADSPDATMKMISPPAPVASQSASTVATPAAEAEEPATPVTLAGCVERSGEGFALKNASGEGAPSSRSWKSGFLRKRSQSVALIDRGYTHRLATYVGQRVETTGVLADREMRVKTLRVLGSCD